MKLSYSPTSPYARKVRAVAHLKGLAERIELVAIDTWSVPQSLRAANPLGKIPCLERDDGTSLYDSPVICEYLDQMTPAPRLFPPEGEARWAALRLQALADGIMDAAVERYVEQHRPPDKQMAEWSARQAGAITRALDHLEAWPAELASESIGTVSLACALGYLDLRFPADHWRNGRAALTVWFEMCANQSWMIATKPVLKKG
jgi:glutathione S-transferase